jgi:hypothetical protein
VADGWAVESVESVDVEGGPWSREAWQGRPKPVLGRGLDSGIF